MKQCLRHPFFCKLSTAATAAALALILLQTGCGKSDTSSGGGDATKKQTIQNKGSDTMVNLAQAWAEEYKKVAPDVDVEVSGGGSGTGIAALEKGTIDIANASRNMKPEEIETAKKNTGKEPKEFIVGYDALAIYVHKDNPLDSISMEELAEIYGEDGKATKWSQLGVKDGKLAGQDITRVSRQSSSGTYTYFREVVLGPGKDYKLGSIDQSGSKDVVALVSRTPSAIGYSGMGYSTPEVKMLKVSKRRGQPGVAPIVANASNGSYPITRPLQIYVIGEPAGAIKQYLDWILSPEGQKVVLELGYVPAKLHE